MASYTISSLTFPQRCAELGPPRGAARVALLWMGAAVGLPLLLAWAQGARGEAPAVVVVEQAQR
jgi:hypothetical protein